MILQIERLLASCDQDEKRRVLRIARYKKEADEKLVGWRKSFVEDAASTAQSPEQAREALTIIMEMVHQDSQNQQEKFALIRQQARYLLRLLLPALATLLVFGYAGGFNWVVEPHSGPLNNTPVGQLLISGALIGFFGGLMSVSFALMRSGPNRKLPMIRGTFAIQTLRSVLGAAAAIPVVFLVKAGVINVGENGNVMLAGLCFIAGFSERWFIERLDATIAAATSSKEPK